MDKSNASPATAQAVKTILDKMGYSQYGFAHLHTPLSLDFYRDWLSQGLHGEMSYLERHLPFKENPEKLLPKAHSAIVLAFHYRPTHPSPKKLPIENLRIASYAAGEDYHDWLQKQLEQIVQALLEHFPDAAFLGVTDSSPVLERDLAYRAGLGWFGKNTCLIDQAKGSFFLIGEILTSLELDPIRALAPDRCGTCRRCIDACPTGALLGPRLLDARRCISFLTIESKKTPPPELAEKMGDYFFGCDICQSVCPWNEKALSLDPLEGKSALPASSPSEENGLIQDLKYILNTPGPELEAAFRYTPMARSRSFGLKRNALIVAANKKLKALQDDIKSLLPDPRLGELAQWALKQLLN